MFHKSPQYVVKIFFLTDPRTTYLGSVWAVPHPRRATRNENPKSRKNTKGIFQKILDPRAAIEETFHQGRFFNEQSF